MADIPARTEVNSPHATQGEGDHAEHGGGGAAQLRVTTGPIRGSRKIYVEGRDGVRVAMRAVDPSRRRASRPSASTTPAGRTPTRRSASTS